jgi:transposase
MEIGTMSTETATKTPKKRGRKTKFTPETCKLIVDTITEGNTLKIASALAGVEEQTIFNWMERGQREGSGEYFEFFESLTRAKASAQQLAVKALVSAFGDDWRAAMEYLARRAPEDWAKKDNLKVEAKHEGEIVIKVKRIDSNGNTI